MGYGILWLPWGGPQRPPSEIKEVVISDPMLLKVILKPIKVMITCTILGPYLKIQRDIEI